MINNSIVLALTTLLSISVLNCHAGRTPSKNSSPTPSNVVNPEPKTPEQGSRKRLSASSKADLDACEINLREFFDEDSDSDCPQSPKDDGDWASEYLTVEEIVPGEDREAFYERLKTIMYEKYHNGDSHIIGMCKTARTDSQVRILLQEIARQAAIAIPDSYLTPKRRGTARHKVCATMLTSIQEAEKENMERNARSPKLATPIRRARVEQPFFEGRSAKKRKGVAIPDVYVEFRKPGVTPSPKRTIQKGDYTPRKRRRILQSHDNATDSALDNMVIPPQPLSPYKSPKVTQAKNQVSKIRYKGVAYDYKTGVTGLQKHQREHNRRNLSGREGVEFKGTFEIKE